MGKKQPTPKKVQSTRRGHVEPAPASVEPEPVEPVVDEDGGSGGGDGVGKDKRVVGAGKKNIKMTNRPKMRQTQGQRAGISFPVARIRRYMKQGNFGLKRISAGSAVCMSAILEYMVAEVLEIALTETKRQNKKVLTPRFINMAIREDTELNDLLNKVTVPGGGVVPYIHPNLVKPLPPKRRSNKKK